MIVLVRLRVLVYCVFWTALITTILTFGVYDTGNDTTPCQAEAFLPRTGRLARGSLALGARGPRHRRHRLPRSWWSPCRWGELGSDGYPCCEGLKRAQFIPVQAVTTRAAGLSPQRLRDITDDYVFNTPLRRFMQYHAEGRYPGQLDWSSDGCTNAFNAPAGWNFLPACQRHDFGTATTKTRAGSPTRPANASTTSSTPT